MAENNTVHCLLCPKGFASEVALRNHVKIEHVEAFVTGDPKMWTLVEHDPNEDNSPLETDVIDCPLCSKGFASEAALRNHAKMEHIKAFVIGDPSIWTMDKKTQKCKTKRESSRIKKSKISHHSMRQKNIKENENRSNPTASVDLKEEHEEIAFVDVKVEHEDSEDSDDQLPFEIIMEEPVQSDNNSVAEFVELPMNNDETTERSNVTKKHLAKSDKTQSTSKGSSFNPNQISKSDKSTQHASWKIENKSFKGVSAAKKPRLVPLKICQVTTSTELIINGRVVAKIVHENHEKLFECSECKRRFNQQTNLERHYRIHSSERPYQCEVCKKCFTQQNNLERHTRIHTSEKDFECSVCKKCFNQKNNLERHFRIHTSEKPFQCILCEKRFSQKNNLERHFRCHTGDEQFECYLCKKRFIQKNNLERHFRIHSVMTI